jgi:small subunit ribosomal protein S6
VLGLGDFMAFYECVFIVRQDINASDVHKITNLFTGILEKEGASIKKTEYWGLRSLAYKIAKNKKGHYVMIAFEGEAASVEEVQRNLRNNESVLRYMTTKVCRIEEAPSSMMQLPLNSAELDASV